MNILITFKQPLTISKKYGFYSPQSDEKFGHLIWSTPHGEHVKVTEVTSDPKGNNYKWPDKINMGEVINYVSGTTLFSNSVNISWSDTND